MEEEVLRQVVGSEHAAFAGHRQLADLGGREPVDLEHADRSVGEAEEACHQVLSRRVHLASRFRVNAHDLAPSQITHHVEVVRREVDDHADVADALRKRPETPSVQLEHAAELAFASSEGELQPQQDQSGHGLGVVKQMLTDFETVPVQLSAAIPDDVEALIVAGPKRRRDRLLDEHVAAGGDGVHDHSVVVDGGCGDDQSLGLLAFDELLVRAVSARPVHRGDLEGRVRVRVGDSDEVDLAELAQHAHVVATHHTGADDGDASHSALTAATIRSRSGCSRSGWTGSDITDAATRSVTGVGTSPTTSLTCGKWLAPIG